MARLRDLEAKAETLAIQSPAAVDLPVVLHPAIATRYGEQVTALAQALHHTGNRAALYAARSPSDRVVVHPPEMDDDPPGIEVIGQLVERLEVAHVGRNPDKAGGTHDETVLSLFASSVKDGPRAWPFAGLGGAQCFRPLPHPP